MLRSGLGHALSTLLGTLSELEAFLSLPWVYQSKHEVHITLLYSGSRCRWRAQTGSFNLKASKAAYFLYQGSVHVVEFEIAVLVISDVCPAKPA